MILCHKDASILVDRSAAVTPLTSLADVRAFLGLALDDPRFLAAQRALAAEEGASLAAEEDAPVFDLAARPSRAASQHAESIENFTFGVLRLV